MPPKEEPAPQYFLFKPVDLPDGKYTNPQLGDIEPGRIYAVRARHVNVFADHPDWQKASKSEYTAQNKES